ncbi:Protein of unknown function [Pyronema omphalodes CBS 100304]|uniref:Uncharacterized protein n=1 Tax=Pyronema omphalodes (strain CBS 100304) TaxID=1076935 RepID=U4LGC4_PYROM|nr:Protein of unknown function [Pyronema omphalodes CBS 100304]
MARSRNLPHSGIIRQKLPRESCRIMHGENWQIMITAASLYVFACCYCTPMAYIGRRSNRLLRYLDARWDQFFVLLSWG